MPDNTNDYIIIEKEYWKSPVRVFTGLTWMTFGLVLGVSIGVFI